MVTAMGIIFPKWCSAWQFGVLDSGGFGHGGTGVSLTVPVAKAIATFLDPWADVPGQRLSAGSGIDCIRSRRMVWGRSRQRYPETVLSARGAYRFSNGLQSARSWVWRHPGGGYSAVCIYRYQSIFDGCTSSAADPFCFLRCPGTGTLVGYAGVYKHRGQRGLLPPRFDAAADELPATALSSPASSSRCCCG